MWSARSTSAAARSCSATATTISSCTTTRSVAGTVDGGAGFDTRTYDINATATVGALVNFEGVTKTGTGVLTITGPGVTDLGAVDVLGGTLNMVHRGAWLRRRADARHTGRRGGHAERRGQLMAAEPATTR